MEYGWVRPVDGMAKGMKTVNRGALLVLAVRCGNENERLPYVVSFGHRFYFF